MIYWSIAINVHESYERTIDIATQADTEGMDYVWIVDFPSPRFAPPIAAKIASNTSAVRIGIGLLPSPIYTSDYITQTIETLVEEFGNRFEILIGPGDRHALRAVGVRKWVPRQIVDNTVASAIRIKKNFQERGINCPVLLAAQGPRMISESNKLDGVLLNLIDSEMVKWAIDKMGVRQSSFKIGVFSPTKLKNAVETPPSKDYLFSAAIVAFGASKSLLQEFGLYDEITSAKKEFDPHKGINSELLEKIAPKLLDRWGLNKTVDELLESAMELTNLGITQLVFGPPISHSMSSIKLLFEALKKYRMQLD